MAAVKACLGQDLNRYGLAALKLAGPSLVHSLSLLCFRGSGDKVSDFKSQRRRTVFDFC